MFFFVCFLHGQQHSPPPTKKKKKGLNEDLSVGGRGSRKQHPPLGKVSVKVQ